MLAVKEGSLPAPLCPGPLWSGWAEILAKCDGDNSDCFLQAECHNFLRILDFANHTHLFVCGTFAFNPLCGFVVSTHWGFALP